MPVLQTERLDIYLRQIRDQSLYIELFDWFSVYEGLGPSVQIKLYQEASQVVNNKHGFIDQTLIKCFLLSCYGDCVNYPCKLNWSVNEKHTGDSFSTSRRLG